MNLSLFPSHGPPRPPPGIDLRCCGVDEVLAEVRWARLIHADPPWSYSEKPGVANPDANGIYSCLSDRDIAAHLDANPPTAISTTLIANLHKSLRALTTKPTAVRVQAGVTATDAVRADVDDVETLGHDVILCVAILMPLALAPREYPDTRQRELFHVSG